jgi:hypothetical protein
MMATQERDHLLMRTGRVTTKAANADRNADSAGSVLQGGIDAPIDQGILHGFEPNAGAVFDGVTASEMDQEGALLSLFCGMTADFDQGLDHPLECVHVVIVDHKAILEVQIVGCGYLLPFKKGRVNMKQLGRHVRVSE